MLITQSYSAFGVEYGDLYEVEWCPCNPDDQYDKNGSVVLGKTVMCPCDSMYSGYHASLEKDVRKVQAYANKAVEKASHFKYYVGVDYNKSQITNTDNSVNFKSNIFSSVNGKDVPASLIMDHQDNIGLVIGTRPIPNLGIEAFYSRSYSKNEVTQVSQLPSSYHLVSTYTTEYHGYGIDLLGYLPVSDYFDFIAFVGVGHYEFKHTAGFEVRYLDGSLGPVDNFGHDFSEKTLAYRLGGGFQFNIARGLVLRMMYRYIHMDTDLLKFTQEFSVGVRFLF